MARNKKYAFISALAVIALVGFFISLQGNYKIYNRPPSVIIIVIDSLRADHLGCFGYTRNTSPNIDRFAKQGIRFPEAISAAGWTGGSVFSILTGTYPPVHQVRSWNGIRNHSIKTLAQKLELKGYYSMFWANHKGAEDLDIQDGFQEVRKTTKSHHGNVINDYELTREITARLTAVKNKAPFFLYIHYSGAHTPYRPLPPYKNMYLHDKYRKKLEYVPICNFSSKDENYKGEDCIPFLVAENNITNPDYYISQYDGAISYSDAQVGLLMDSLKNIGLDKNAMIVITTDHGELLGEHGIYFNHAGGYEGGYEENMRIPLIIKLPRRFIKNRVFYEPVSLIDVAPTILDVVGLDKPAYMQGESLMVFLRPFKVYSKKYLLCFFAGDWVALRSREWKLVCNYIFNSWKLYDLKNDPKETRNLAYVDPTNFERLRNIFNDLIKQIAPSTTAVRKGFEFTEGEGARLGSLRYNQ